MTWQPPFWQHNPLRTVSPTERYVPFLFKLVVYGWLSYFFYQAATTFIEYVPGRPWPFMLAIVRTFTFLPIHEAGHMIFSFFGRTLHILGGSFWQIVFPLLWFIIAAKQKSHIAPFALFWVGENILDVSLYMRDAPVRQMPLLGGHISGHDWYNLFTDWNMLDSAETIADLMYGLGFIICAGAILSGFIVAFRSFIKPPAPEFASDIEKQASVLTIEDSLNDILVKKSGNRPAQ